MDPIEPAGRASTAGRLNLQSDRAKKAGGVLS